MPGYVLDAFAVVAVLFNEPAAPRVTELLDSAANGQTELSLSVVNLGEAIYAMSFRRDPDTAAESLSKILAWPVRLVDVDQTLALSAAAIKADYRMGYLDCFVVALAQALDATVVTGDPDFHRVEDAVSIEWLATA